MNGENPNNVTNNELNSTSLGPISLGNVQNNQNVGSQNVNPTPVPNNPTTVNPNPIQMPNNVGSEAPAVESLDIAPQMPSTPSEPVARPIPGTEGMVDNVLTGNTVGVNNNFNVENNVNGFTNANKVENIGAVPPQNNEEKKKKPMNKILFILLIVVLIGAVAFGVYYFLNISNNAVKLTTKTLSIGVGETLPDDIKEYITATKGNISTCSINTKNVDISTIGEYEVTINCGKNIYKTKVIVSDKTAPEVKLNMVFKTINSTVTVEDFVKSCNDPSNCKTNFADEAKVKEYLLTAGGPYEVGIEATDDAGNKEVYNAILYVTNEEISLFADFTSAETSLTEYKVKKTVNDIFSINRALVFQGAARRDYKYTFENQADYEEIVKDKADTITFDGVTGLARYNDKNLTLEISTDLSLDTLKSENNGEFPTSYQEIQAIYKDTKGYTPSFIRSYPQTESEE